MNSHNTQKKPTKILRGGIGDLLIRLGNIKADEHYVVISHYNQAPELVKPYTEDFEFIPMVVPIGTVPNEVEPEVYPLIKIPNESIERAKNDLPVNKKIVGIHPIGSKISRDVDTSLSRPIKSMSLYFLQGLINSLSNNETELLLFCASDEVNMYSHLNIKIVAEPNIWDCFAYVSLCDLVIATESAIKTISAILHIPTIVLLGNFFDPYRKFFIHPYKEIIPIEFTNIDDVFNLTVSCASGILKSK